MRGPNRGARLACVSSMSRITRCRWPAHGSSRRSIPASSVRLPGQRPADQVRQVVVADGDGVGVAQRARRDLRDRPRADAPHGEQPAPRLLDRQVRALLQPARHDGRGPQHGAGPGLLDAGPSPVPDRAPSRAGRASAARRMVPRSRTGCGVPCCSTSRRHAALASSPTTFCSRIAGTSASSTLPDRGIRSAVRLPVGVADHRVQRRVEPASGRRGPRAGRGPRRAHAPRPGPHAVTWTPSLRTTRWRVAGPSAVDVACQTAPSGANHHAGSPPPRRSGPSVSRTSTRSRGR